MKFSCLLPVRDEADIIGQCLRHALTWADAIYVFDTGSVDDTWEIVQDFAARDRRVIPLRKEPVYFSETRLRGWMFHQARQQMRDVMKLIRIHAQKPIAVPHLLTGLMEHPAAQPRLGEINRLFPQCDHAPVTRGKVLHDFPSVIHAAGVEHVDRIGPL